MPNQLSEEKRAFSRINFIFLKLHCVVVEIFGSEYLEYLLTMNCGFHLVSSIKILVAPPKGHRAPTELRLLPRVLYQLR